MNTKCTADRKYVIKVTYPTEEGKKIEAAIRCKTCNEVLGKKPYKSIMCQTFSLGRHELGPNPSISSDFVVERLSRVF